MGRGAERPAASVYSPLYGRHPLRRRAIPREWQPVTFMTLAEFYADRPVRESSGEADFGQMWKFNQTWPLRRVSYVRATGEVYAYELVPTVFGDGMPRPRVMLIGQIPVSEEVGGHWTDNIDRILGDGEPDGWAHQDDLQWLIDRVRAAELSAGVNRARGR